VIPASVNMVGSWEFHHCSELKSVDFEEGSRLQRAGKEVFTGCLCERERYYIYIYPSSYRGVRNETAIQENCFIFEICLRWGRSRQWPIGTVFLVTECNKNTVNWELPGRASGILRGRGEFDLRVPFPSFFFAFRPRWARFSQAIFMIDFLMRSTTC
jgi:hypothetical protein